MHNVQADRQRTDDSIMPTRFKALSTLATIVADFDAAGNGNYLSPNFNLATVAENRLTRALQGPTGYITAIGLRGV